MLNDGTGGKMGVYLHNKVSVTAGGCTADGLRRLQVTVTMHSSAPASGLPKYVTGPMDLVKPYSIQTNVSVFAPFGGRVEHAVVDGVFTGPSVGVDGAIEVGTVTSVLKPGATSEIIVRRTQSGHGAVLPQSRAGSDTGSESLGRVPWAFRAVSTAGYQFLVPPSRLATRPPVTLSGNSERTLRR